MTLTTFAEDAAKEQLWQKPPVWHCLACGAPMASWTEEECPNPNCQTRQNGSKPKSRNEQYHEACTPHLIGLFVGIVGALPFYIFDSHLSLLFAGVVACSFANLFRTATVFCGEPDATANGRADIWTPKPPGQIKEEWLTWEAERRLEGKL